MACCFLCLRIWLLSLDVLQPCHPSASKQRSRAIHFAIKQIKGAAPSTNGTKNAVHLADQTSTFYQT
jgi:hypothetical protein